MKRKITTLVFDLGGVLTRPQSPTSVRALMDELGLDGDVERFKAAYFAHRDEYDRGSLDMRGYWDSVCGALGMPTPVGRLAAISRHDQDCWFQYRPRMIEALPSLRSRLRRLGILSNINAEGVARLRSAFPRLDLMDGLTLSCELKLMKPEAAIFRSCLESLGSEPGESLFIDDTLANVEGARAAGLYSFRFVDEEHFFEELETFYELSR